MQADHGLGTQTVVEGVVQPLGGDLAALHGLLDAGKVLVHIVDAEDHVATGLDAGGQSLGAGQGVKAHHGGLVGYHKAMEAQLLPQQAGDQLFRGAGGGHVRIPQGGVQLFLVGRQGEVADHDGGHAPVDAVLVHLAEGGIPLLAA